MAILLDFKWFHRWFICSSRRWISAASSWLAPPLDPSSICLIIFLPVAVRDKKFSLSVSISNCRSYRKKTKTDTVVVLVQNTVLCIDPMTTIKLHGCMLFYKGRDLLGDPASAHCGQSPISALNFDYCPSVVSYISPLQNCVFEEIKAVFRLLRKKGGKPGGKPDIFIIILSLISNFHIVLIKYQLQRFLF